MAWVNLSLFCTSQSVLILGTRSWELSWQAFACDERLVDLHSLVEVFRSDGLIAQSFKLVCACHDE